MKTEKFIEYIQNKKKKCYTMLKFIKPQKFIHNRIVDEYYSNYQQLMVLKEMTADIDFGCNFKDGKCQYYRNSNHLQCCCGGCNLRIGFLKYMPTNRIKYYARNFSTKTGFWRKEVGCILPRKYRSKTCVTHMCDMDIMIRFQKQSQQVLKLTKLTNLMDSIRQRLEAEVIKEERKNILETQEILNLIERRG